MSASIHGTSSVSAIGVGEGAIAAQIAAIAAMSANMTGKAALAAQLFGTSALSGRLRSLLELILVNADVQQAVLCTNAIVLAAIVATSVKVTQADECVGAQVIEDLS